MAENITTVETWKPVVGWEGLYEVSDRGRVRSLGRVVETVRGPRHKKGIILASRWSGGYDFAALYKDGMRRSLRVHRLVMAAFMGPCPDGMEVCHNNGNPSDNRLVNLRYDTASGNRLDRQLHGTDHEVNKTHCPRGHLLVHPNLVPSRLREGMPTSWPKSGTMTAMRRQPFGRLDRTIFSSPSTHCG